MKANIKYILVVVAVAVAAVAGIWVYQQQGFPIAISITLTIPPSKGAVPISGNDWTEPVTSEASGSTWGGVVVLINQEEKYLIIFDPGRETTAYFQRGTKVSGSVNNIADLKGGDVVTVSGEYQMRGKMTGDWEVRMFKTKTIFVGGRCAIEGQTGDRCCPGLEKIGSGSEQYCTKCGDSVCKLPENNTNCPADCAKQGEISSFLIFNLSPLTGRNFIGNTIPGNKEITVKTNDLTKFYMITSAVAPGETQQIYFTYSEFKAMLGGDMGACSLGGCSVKGLVGDSSIQATEISYWAQ